jgi:hypothetical protein
MNQMEEFDTELQSVANRLRTRVRELEAKLAPIQEQLSRLRVQLELVDRALSAHADATHESVQPPTGEAVTKIAVAERVFEILRDAGRPLHVSEIKTQYEGKGWRIPGQGRESNLLVYIVRDSRFTRVSKGTYALKEDGMPPVVPSNPKTKRRRRRKP